VPAVPPEAAQRANEDGLRAHREGRFDESLRLFREAAAAAPDHDLSRFNAACALARLGRLDEARRELGALLCRDLPTHAARLRTDEDLAPLRDDPALRDLIGRLETRYRAATGAPLVAYRIDGDAAVWTQAVIYDHAPRRIVPVGPRLRERGPGGGGTWPMVAMLFDPASARVLAVTYLGNDAEDPHLDRMRLRTFRAPLGEPEADGGAPDYVPYLLAGFTPDGAIARTQGFDAELLTWRVDGRSFRPTRDPFPPVHLEAGQIAWRIVREQAGHRVAGGRLVTPDGEIELGAGRGSMRHHALRVDQEAGIAVVASGRWGDCGYRDRYVVDVVDLRARTSRRLLEGEGQVHVEIGPDKALYVQLLDGVRRYADPRSDRFDRLPDGLGISSAPWDGNPYC
jgi:hypothetical protein